MASRVVLDLPPSLLLYLTSLVPLSVLILTKLVFPFINAFLLPTAIKSALREPGDGSLPLEDEEEDAATSTHRQAAAERGWKPWVLSGLGGLETVAWSVGVVLLAVQGEARWWEVLATAGVACGWVYATLSPLLRPPASAPFLLFTFYLSHLVFLILHTISSSLHSSALPHQTFILNATLTAVHAAFLLALLGTTTSYRLTPPTEATEIAQPPSAKEDDKDEITLPSPEGDVTLFSWIIFAWVSGIIKKGQKAKLGYSDVWMMPSNMMSEGVRRSAMLLKSTRVIPRIWKNNSLDLTLSLTLGFTSSFLSYCGPYFLKQILESLTPPPSGEPVDQGLRKSAYIYAVLAFAAQIARAEVDLQQLWHERRAIIRCRTQLMGEVYEKALKRRDLSGVIAPKEEDAATALYKKSKKGEEAKKGPPAAVSTGKIVNLMSTDCNKVANQLMNLSSIVAAPFELVVAIAFLYQLLGWTAIAGLSIMAISLPLNHVLVKRRIRIHRSVLASRDRRMEVLNEFVQAIRFVKYSASEEQWLGKVFNARTAELAWLLKTRMNNLMINIVWNFTPDLVMLISFACFTKIMGRELTVPTAFTSLALFALVRGPMNMLPSSITQLLQTYVSIQRLEAFFDEPEVEPWVSALRPDASSADASGERSSRIAILDGTFRYQDITTAAPLSNPSAPPPLPPVSSTTASPSVPEPVASTSTLAVPSAPASEVGSSMSESEAGATFELRDINVDFPVGKLSLIAGPTGSGKSSMFLALLGEMDRVAGEVVLHKGTVGQNLDTATGLYEGVAYASQLPWLQHASIKDNILFGSPMEDDRYSAVIDACALKTDLAMFDAGDETEIGEKGISLSGGQKARVALARAVYSRAKTVLLDDPLSAVDSHTAKHLFRKCLKGPILADRTIILITHHISLCLPGADFLVRLSAGRIETQGLVSELDTSEIAEELEVEAEEEESETTEAEEIAEHKKDLVETAATKALGPPSAGDASANPTRTPSPSGEAVSVVKGTGKLVEEEARAEGRVKSSVYLLYLKAAGIETWIAIVLLILAGRSFRVVDRYWFKYWGESYHSSHSAFSSLFLPRQQMTLTGFEEGTVDLLTLPSLPSASENVNPYLAIYGLICLVNLLITVLGVLAGYHGSFQAARILFTKTLTQVAHAPFRYFDTTPTGRILNRFSTDFQIIDTSLTDQVRICMTHAFSFLVNVGVIVLVSPRFIPPAVLIIYFYVRLSLSYVKCSRDLRRLESNARSPIFSKFGETLAGIVTCRAFGAERRFLDTLFMSVDKMLAVNYASSMINRYLLWRFDCLGAIAVAITTLLALVGGASPGLAALAITSAQSLVQSVYWLCRFISALEVDLNAVERVTELLNTPQEPPMVIEGKRPPAYWPSDMGGVSVEDLVISYAPTLPPVIKGVSFEIAPREKVGVVGRTGSGKSTMALSLLRFTDPTSGRIMIDGIDITSIGLADLRGRLTLIPQEAVLFSGTIRSNLDPFNEHSDQDCMDALARVRMISAPVPPPSHRGSREPSRASSPVPGQLSATAALLEAHGHLATTNADSASIASGSSTTKVDTANGRIGVTLETLVSAGGHNFSAGQRQLLAMARALLKRSKIIIMDEATASVDMETDAKIQHTIQEEFADSLVITIAHRLSTVVDYDKVLVLDQGTLVEYDSPKNLLQREGGSFRKMCEQAADWETLKSKAGL